MPTRLHRFYLLLSVVVLLPLTAAHGQDFWNGGTGNWSDAGQWSKDAVPGINDDTTIHTRFDYVTLDTHGYAKSLSIGGNGGCCSFSSGLTDGGTAQTLTIANSLSVGEWGYVDLHGGTTVTVGADSVNEGQIDLRNASFMSITGNLVNKNHEEFIATNNLSIGGGSGLYVTGKLTNEHTGSFSVGSFDLGAAGAVANVGSLANSGQVFVGPGANLNLMNQAGGITDIPYRASFEMAGNIYDVVDKANGFAHLSNIAGDLLIQNGQITDITPPSGPLTLAATGRMDAGNNSSIIIHGDLSNSGTVSTSYHYSNLPGRGTINVDNFINNPSGTVTLNDPGDALNAKTFQNNGSVFLEPGTNLNVAHGFYQLAGGTLGEATGPNGYGVIVVTHGAVMLGGTLDILPGFYPPKGSFEEFINFVPGELTGTFASILNADYGNEKWVVIYDNAGGYVALEAVYVPEPSSLLLLGSGVLGIAFRIRRRMR
jgi:hypothetical protein